MLEKPQLAIFLLLPLVVILIAIFSITNIDDLSDKDRAARILLLNFQSCGNISKIGREYGEGTLTVKCTNGKIYLLSALEHCHDRFTAYCWKIKELDSKLSPFK